MNISGTNYNNYPQAYSINPISGIKSNSSDADLKNESQLNPVVNTALKQPPQVTETGNTPSNIYSPSKPDEIQTSDTQTRETQGPNAQDQKENSGNTKTVNGHALTQAEIQLVETLKQVDSEVRAHEMAHVAAGGRFITSGASFSYKKGPDGKNYAVGGEVGIDTSAVPGDPAATIQKMRQVKSSALAPTNPSSQDLKVASKAGSMASKAMSELLILRTKEQAQSNEKAAFGDLKNAAGSYEKVNNLPETDTSTVQIAV